MSSKRYAQDLQKEVEKLAYKAETVHNAVEEAINNLRSVYDQVMKWQASAEKALMEARGLLDEVETLNKIYCYRTLPNINFRYQFSKKAKDKIEEIKQLTQDCSELQDLSFTAPASGNCTASTLARREGKDFVPSIKLRDDGIFESRASIIRDIMDALVDNSNSVVGVYGMGGVGKSTLLADAASRIKEEGLFDWVAEADVSENPDIKRIQGEIAHALDLDIKNEEYFSERAEHLHTRLENEEKKEKKVLIILDNLWKGLDLKSVGIPCGHDNKVMGCKILLTSRKQDVLRREMGCDRDFHLGELWEEEAKNLFAGIVGDKVRADEFKPFVDEALRICEGVPFLIIAIAKRFKDANLSEWKDALKRIEMFKDREISAVINKMLQWSYDDLEEEVKLTLQLCVVYGVSKPSLENLLRYGMGLGLFREFNMEEARDRLFSLIRTLKASSLLDNGDDDGFKIHDSLIRTLKASSLLDNGDDDGFKIHDLVREFVASVVPRPLLILKDKDQSKTELPKDKLKNCWAICFPYIDTKELLEELNCPELEILLLFTNNEFLDVPDSLFYSMRRLTVLNLTGIRLTRSLLSIQLLENLHTLCLEGCSLEDIALLGELKGLQILSFAHSKIWRLPKEIGQLVKLKLLDLSYCSKLQIIEPGVLGSLIKMEELYVENSFDQWNAVEQTPPTNACLIELAHMKNLRTLYVCIPDPSVLPEDLNFEKFTKYKIRLGNALRWSEHRGSRTLEIKLDPISDVLRKGCVQSILGKIDDLFLDGLKIEQSICALSREGFPKLKDLQVENSPSVHYILQLPSHTDFKMLKSLILKNLINLEKICFSHMSYKSFSALKVVRVDRCHKMGVLFPLSLLRELQQLEEIRVIYCHLMQEIIEVDICDKVELHHLHVLELKDLPEINNFSTARMAPSSSTSDNQIGTQVAFFNGQQVLIPFLESLVMERLPNLKETWSDESPLGLSNLRSLHVVQCKSLSKVIDF
ncbi:hypothetical protein BT93_H0854, partial [Corymbia citriodora subsp. variegata]